MSRRSWGMLPRLVDSMRSGVAHDFEDCIKDTIVFVWACALRSFDFVLARTIDVGSGSRAQVAFLAVFRVRVSVNRIQLFGSILTVFGCYSCVKSVEVSRGALLMMSDRISEVKM